MGVGREWRFEYGRAFEVSCKGFRSELKYVEWQRYVRGEEVEDLAKGLVCA
jgi:hypothetical protein